ncbi:hypothetical protein Pelo_7602 [Pelomyxa schiedti]|nr:hypothetical protein Pelo_7602 [Pelomyxa schiedti]
MVQLQRSTTGPSPVYADTGLASPVSILLHKKLFIPLQNRIQFWCFLHYSLPVFCLLVLLQYACNLLHSSSRDSCSLLLGIEIQIGVILYSVPSAASAFTSAMYLLIPWQLHAVN